MHGRHRPYGRASRSQRVLLSTLGVLALIGLIAVTVKTVTAQAEGCGGSGSLQLTVAAAPAIAPAVRDAASQWQKGSPRAGGQCVRVDVQAVPPAEVAADFAAHNGGTLDTGAVNVADAAKSTLPAVWIPDSISWLNRLSQVNQTLFETSTPDIAMSPVVAGMPDAAARALVGSPGNPLKLTALGAAINDAVTGKGKFRLAVSDPRSDAAGLAGAIVLKDIIVQDPAKDLPTLVAVDRIVGASRAADTTALTGGFSGSNPLTAVPMSEQQVLAYDQDHPNSPLDAVAFSPPAKALDYPYAAVEGAPHNVGQAADMFRAALTGSPQYRSMFAKYGFREPDGTAAENFPAGNGAAAGKVTAQRMSDTTEVNNVVGVWAGANTPSRLLALADVTSSMNAPLSPAGGPSRLGVLMGAATRGLGLFTNDSQIGLWGFAAGLPGGRDYVPSVGVATLDQAQRDRLQATLTHLTTAPTTSRGLYESILAAYKVMRDGYEPNMSNVVVVFTGGTETKPGGMTIDQAMTQLQEMMNTTRPVRIVAIGVGSDVDMSGLKKLAVATSGKDFQVQSPDQINQVFLEALLKIHWESS